MQTPSFIRLSGQLRQHRSGAGPAGARGDKGRRGTQGPEWRLGRARSRDSQGRDRPSRLKAVAGRAREEGDGCEQCGQCGAVQGRPGVMLRRAVLLATPRASTRERPDGADAERTDSSAALLIDVCISHTMTLVGSLSKSKECCDREPTSLYTPSFLGSPLVVMMPAASRWSGRKQPKENRI